MSRRKHGSYVSTAGGVGIWTKKRPVDLVTRWAQQEPFQGHGGGGSRLQWVEEGIRFDKMEIANWRQLLKKKEKSLPRRGGKGRAVAREVYFSDVVKLGMFMSRLGETRGSWLGRKVRKESR